MEFFGITLYGPQNFIRDTMRLNYLEPMNAEEVKPLMDNIAKNSPYIEKVIYKILETHPQLRMHFSLPNKHSLHYNAPILTSMAP